MGAKPILNAEQKDAFRAIQKFIEHPAANTFVLKGYAGTGKTFLMQHLAKWLKDNDYKFSLLASTGRAAAVLRGKTGFQAKTLHSELYSFSSVSGDEEDIAVDAPTDKFGQMTLQFSLRKPDETDSKKIYIIDESSMLSSELQSDISSVAFGSGFLLIDFFEAAGNNKIIFVGDPGQLPPVGQTYSPALDMDWLVRQNRNAISMALEKIERQDPNNDLLILASYIRNMAPAARFPKLPASGMNNVKIYLNDKDLFNAYRGRFRQAGPSETLAIARSNKMVSIINRAIRRDLHGGLDLPVQNGDILMVVHNNYSVPFANGDFAVITELGEESYKGNLNFKSVKIKSFLSDDEFEILLCLDLLYSKEGNLSNEQSRDLMIEFSRKMKRQGIKSNSDEYRDEMMKDKYLNCLRAKYGYAVTCHKAQGGEWNEVFLFLEKSMYAMERKELYGWWYTAVTRAKTQLNLANAWWIV